MCNPYHEKGNECRVFEQRLRLLPTKGLLLHRWCLFREVVKNSLPFGFIQKRYCLWIIRKVEESYNRAENCWHSFEDEELFLYQFSCSQEFQTNQHTHRQPARPPAPFMKDMA